MAKLQVKKSPAPRKAKKETESEGKTESEEAVRIEEALEQDKTESEEAKTTEEAADNEPTDMAADSDKEPVEETKSIEAEEPATDVAKEEAKTPSRRSRKRSKKAKSVIDGEESKPSDDTKLSDKKITKSLSGIIFMCNQATKRECFRHKVFGLPETKKDLVLQLKTGMKLFLYDIDLRLLYGVYEASSNGGLNLVPKAFKSSFKSFPAQVRFKITKDCVPLSEDAFKPSIKENYVGRSRFKVELDAQQVKRLQQLFRPIGSSSRNTTARLRDRVERPVGQSTYRQEPIYNYNAKRTAQRFSERRSAISDYPISPLRRYGVDAVSDLELRRLDYSREPSYVPADPYVLARAHLTESTHIDPGYNLVNPAYDIDPLYRQRTSKRPLDDLYLSDPYSLPAPKRAHFQDDIYRDLEYQRSTQSYPDQRHLSRYYAGGGLY